MRGKYINLIPIIGLIILSLIIAFTNYSFGTFLSGWDTLHPEFNLNLNLQRVIFGVFRENQGLGAIAAHAHMSELPRILYLYLSGLFLPLSFLRYSYVFLCLVIGPIGAYYFLLKFAIKDKTVSFLGALFYLLNLGSMQQFIVPFEMFTTQYAFLPWIFYFTTDYLETGRKKTLILFSITMFLSSPMAYAPVLWYLTLISLITYLAIFSLPTIAHKQFKKLKKPLLIILVSLAVNAYWILPNLHFVANSAKNISEANINKLFSEQAFLYNKEFGTLGNIVFLKTFLFDWSVYRGGDTFEKLLNPWIKHLGNPFVFSTGIFFSFLSLAGLTYAIIKKRRIALSLIPTLLISLFFLFNDNPPFSSVYVFFQNNLPLFKEALRFPDDKVLGLFTFVFSIFTAFGLLFLIRLLEKLKFPKFLLKPTLSILFSFLLIYFMLPAFRGNFISPYMRINIPKEYFAMFKWFDTQKDNGRIANLPINSFWGWEYYNWYDNTKPSYQGAGFIWFGIKQPLLARDFDRWSKYNEQYYREMSYAVYSKDTELLKTVLSKYNIHYLLLDKNIIAPENDPKVLFYEELQVLLNKLENEKLISKATNFGNKISVYKVLNQKSDTYFLNNLNTFGPEANNYYEDFIYSKGGNYIASNIINNYTNYVPFGNIINNQSKLDSNLFKIDQDGIKIKSASQISFDALTMLNQENNILADLTVLKSGKKLEFTIYPRFPGNLTATPLIYQYNKQSEANLVLTFNKKDIFVLPELSDNTPVLLGTVFLSTKKENIISVYSKDGFSQILPDFSKLNYSLSPCEGNTSKDVFGAEKGVSPNSFSLFAGKTPTCLMLPLSQFAEQIKPLNKFLLAIDYNYTGKPLSTSCIAELKTGECINYDLKQFGVKIDNYYELDELNNIGLKIFLDSTQNNSLEKVSYEGFNFRIYKPQDSISFSNDLLAKSILNNRVVNTSLLTIPYTGDIQLSKDITKQPKTNISCDQDPFYINRGLKKEIIKKESDNYIRYESSQGPACDHFSYKNLSHQQAYLITITSRNIKGLPLSLCILNQQSRRCDIYSALSKIKNDQFTKDVFMVPPANDGGDGYDINISNIGINKSPAVNDLKSIQIIPFPYYWLFNILVKEKDLKPDNQTLVYSYSYDPGWKAYQIPKTGPLTTAFPFFFGTELKEHVLVNNWENGWTISKNSHCQLSINNCQFVIIYLPQYLQYLGFVLLIILPFTLLINRPKT